MKKLLFYSVLFLLSAPWPVKTQASPFGYTKKLFTLSSKIGVLTTNKNYDDSGNLLNTVGRGQLREYKLDLASSYDFTSYMAAHLAVDFKQIAIQAPSTSFPDNTVLGPGELEFGSDFLILDSDLKIISDISITAPLSSQPGSDNTAFLSDGAFTATGKLFGSFKVWILKTAIYGGYKWRSLGLSSQIPLGLLVRGDISKKFFAEVDAIGELSLLNDQYTSTPGQRNLINFKYNGGSSLYNAVNPQFVNVRAQGGWNISPRWTLWAGYQTNVWAQRMAEETRIFIGIQWNQPFMTGSGFKPDNKADKDEFQVDLEE